MIAVEPINADVVSQYLGFFEALGQPRMADEICSSRSRKLLGIARSAERPVGYALMTSPPGGQYSVIDARIGVVPSVPDNSVVSAIVDWCCGDGLSQFGNDLIEILVDDNLSDPFLTQVLAGRGFTAEEFVEMSCQAMPGRCRSDDLSLMVRGMTEADLSAAANVYSEVQQGLLSERRAYLDLHAAWHDPCASPADCLIATRQGSVCGFLLCWRWPEDPENLWIESLGASGEDPSTDHTVERALISVARSMPDTWRVGVGVQAARAGSFADLGFRTDRRWLRHRLLLVGQPSP